MVNAFDGNDLDRMAGYSDCFEVILFQSFYQIFYKNRNFPFCFPMVVCGGVLNE